MQSGKGSTRALACSDRRLAGRNGVEAQSRNGDSAGRTNVAGEGADHSTRGRVRSPSHLNRYGLGNRFDRPFGTNDMPHASPLSECDTSRTREIHLRIDGSFSANFGSRIADFLRTSDFGFRIL